MRTKIKIADLQKKLTFPAFRKEFLRLTTGMKSEKVQGGTNAEDAVSIFIKLEHSFVCETEHPLVMVAAHGPAWKKAAKDAFKEDKKKMLEGRCFIDDKKNLNIIVEKGNLKLTELKKVLKPLIKKAGLKTVVFSDGKGTVTAGAEEATPEEASTDIEGTPTDGGATDNGATDGTTDSSATDGDTTSTGTGEEDTTAGETATPEENPETEANPAADAREERRKERRKKKGRKAIETMTNQLEKLMEKLRI